MAATILVADADRITRELMASALGREGFEVATAADDAAVLARCRERAFELAVVSSRLPGRPASELGRELKALAPSTRLVLLVGAGEIEAASPDAVAAKLGCDAVLPRPFRYPALRDLLTRWGVWLPARKEARTPPAASFSVPIAESSFDVSTIAAPEPPSAEQASRPGLRVLAAPTAALQASLPLPIPLAAPGERSVATQPASPTPAAAEPDELLRELSLDEIMAESPPAPEPSPEAATSAPLAGPERPEASGKAEAAAPLSSSARETASAGTGFVGRQPFFGAARRSALTLPAEPEAPSAAALSRTEAPQADLRATAGRATPEPAEETSGAATSPAPAATSAQAAKADADTKRTASLPATLPQDGELREVPLPRLLFELYVATFSGQLRLERQGLTRVIYLWGGMPVHVDSEQVEESLGRLLVEHGRITQEQYESALSRMGDQRLPEAEALLAAGFFEKGELVDILRQQTEKRLANSFGWRDGRYRLEPDSRFAEAMILTEVHPLRSIWRGVSEHYDVGSLMSYFGTLRGRYATGTMLFEVHYESLGPFLRNLDVATLLDGQHTFEAALRSDDIRALEIAQALYVLLVTDMIRASPTPGDPVTLPERDVDLSMSAPVDYRAITRVCDEVNREYVRVKESDYFEALRVGREAAAEAVDEAYARIVRPFTLEALPTGLPDDVQRRAAELCGILGRAKNTLRSRELRERYIEAQRDRQSTQARAAAGERGEPASAGSAETADEVEPGAEDERERRQLAERAYADGLRLSKSGDVEMARQKLAVAVRLNGREPGYRVALARTVLAAAPAEPGPRREATELLQQALKLEPSHVEANFELAKLLVAVDQAAAARPYVMRVLQRAPEHKEARALLSHIVSL